MEAGGLTDPARAVEWWRPARPALSGVARENDLAASLPDAGSPVPFWGLMAFLFILLIAPQNFFPALAPLRIALLAAALSIGAYLFDRIANGRRAGRRTPEIWFGVGILAWAVLTVPLSYWPGGSVALLQEKYVKTLAVFWLITRVVTTRPRLERVIWGLTLMGVPLAATGLKNYLSGDFMPVGDQVKRIVGYDTGLTQNPNDLALMLNLILPFSVALFLRTRRSSLRALLLATTLLYVVGVIVTFSRTGFLTMAVTFLYYAIDLLRRGRWGSLVAALVLSLAAAAMLPSSYLDRIATITDIEADDTGSAQIRSHDTMASVRIVLANPLVGAGIGMNLLALNEERGAMWFKVHNVYLEYAVDLGLPGLVLFLLLLGACLKDARFVQRQIAQRGSGDGLFQLAQGVEAALLAFMLAAAFHPVAYDFFFYLIAGIAVSIRTVYELEEGERAPEPHGAADGPEPWFFPAGSRAS